MTCAVRVLLGHESSRDAVAVDLVQALVRCLLGLAAVLILRDLARMLSCWSCGTKNALLR
jgi:hypothetical protein